jgi:hypothetical protein
MEIPKAALALLSLVIVACNVSANQNTETANSDGYIWKPLSVGAGGFVIGQSTARDGTQFIATDTYGAYKRVNGRWQQVFTAQTLPKNEVSPDSSRGVLAIAVAPSNSSRVYAAWKKSLYRSDNGAQNWQSVLPDLQIDANDDWRTWSQKLAVAPNNPDLVFLGTPNQGLWRSADAGATWTKPSIPAAKPIRPGQDAPNGVGINALLFANDTTVYASSYGNGVLQSRDAGQTWQALGSNGPLEVRHVAVQANRLYATGAEFLWLYENEVWQKISPASDWISVVADSSQTGRIFANNGGGTLYRSLDAGKTWTELERSVSSKNDIAWLSWTNTDYFTSAALWLTPDGKTLWLTSGTGVWKADLDDTQNSVLWQSQSLGIEQLVGNDVVAPPGGQPVVAAWDFGTFYISNPDQTASQQAISKRFNSTWQLAYSSSDPKFLVGNTSDHRGVFCWYWCQRDGASLQAGFSSDGGQTWTPFATFPAPAYGEIDGAQKPLASNWGFGSIAVSTPDNIVWLPTFNKAAHYTRDRGQTWNEIVLPGSPSTQGSHFQLYLNRRTVVADSVQAGVFYLYHSEKGIYKTTNGGSSWALLTNAPLANFSDFNVLLKAVPNVAGALYFTTGLLEGDVPMPFMRSRDGGQTWQTLSTISKVRAFGFGKPQNAAAPSTIFAAGEVAGQYGIYRSMDEGATWKRIADYPMGSLDTIKAIDGDKDVFGKVYVAFSGSGFGYGYQK